MATRRQNLLGQKFGMWTVLRFDGMYQIGIHMRSKWICRCDCGVERSVIASNLKSHTTGCGCERHKRLLKRNTKHGIYGTPAYWNWLSNRKRATRLQATPKWADDKTIRAIYKACPPGHDVDHIVPLTSALVCGLHCEANLQYLPSSVNQSKKNRYWPDMPEAG